MKILGIHDGHNSSAALIINGQLICAIQEERFTYIKNQGGMPVQCLNYLNQKYDLKSIDQAVFSGKYTGQNNWSRENILKYYKTSSSIKNRTKRRLKKNKWVYEFYILLRNKSRINNIPYYIDKPKVNFIDHHLAHASAAYYGNGVFNKKILVITCDGFGDARSGSVYLGENGKLKLLYSLPEKDSIGRVYSYITFLFNMIPYEHEYKIMGLAPYCTDQKRIQQCVCDFDNLFEWTQDELLWTYHGKYTSIQSAGRELEKIYKKYRFDILAAGLQKFIENILVKWIRNLINKTEIHDVALSGGVFMNVKANQLIAQIKEVHSCFVFPSCGDETNSIGAAYWTWFNKTQVPPEPLKHFYLGNDFDIDEKLLKKYQGHFTYKHFDHIESEIAKLLANGEIVGRIKGNMEFGARALGNRSILANPSKPDVSKIINGMIKGRDFWMPFAPSVLDEDFDKYFSINRSVRNYDYMIFTADSYPEIRTYAKAALHPYDCTGRPQIVTEKQNKSYYRLLKEYKKITGEGLVLNTSYNLHGFPIVQAPQQAIDVFLKSGLKYLAINEYLIKK